MSWEIPVDASLLLFLCLALIPTHKLTEFWAEVRGRINRINTNKCFNCTLNSISSLDIKSNSVRTPNRCCTVQHASVFWKNARPTSLDEIFLCGEVAAHSGLNDFHSCALCCKVSRRELFAKCHLYRLYWRLQLYSHDAKFMTIRENQNRDRFKIWQFAVFESSCFVATERWNSRRIAFALPFRESICLFRLPSLANATPRYLNLSTCCGLFPLTCSVYWLHWLWILEEHNTSPVLVRIFIPAWWLSVETRTCDCWKPRSEDASSAKSPAIKQTKDPATSNRDTLWLACDCLCIL